MRPAFKIFLIGYLKNYFWEFVRIVLGMLGFFLISFLGHVFFTSVALIGLTGHFFYAVLIMKSSHQFIYRKTDIYTYPLSEAELRLTDFLSSFFSYTIGILYFLLFLFILTKDAISWYFILFFIPLSLFMVIKITLGIRFKNISKLVHFISLINSVVELWMLYTLSALGFFLVIWLSDYGLNFKRIGYTGFILLLFVPWLVVNVLAGYRTFFIKDTLTLNEHLLFKKAQFKPIYFSMNVFILVVFALLTAHSLNTVSKRKPASIPTIHANPSTQLRK